MGRFDDLQQTKERVEAAKARVQSSKHDAVSRLQSRLDAKAAPYRTVVREFCEQSGWLGSEAGGAYWNDTYRCPMGKAEFRLSGPSCYCDVELSCRPFVILGVTLAYEFHSYIHASTRGSHGAQGRCLCHRSYAGAAASKLADALRDAYASL